MISDTEILVQFLVRAFQKHNSPSLFTVGISGIDASGKGFLTGLVQQELNNLGYKVANINIDPWQNPLRVRLQKENAAENLYENIFQWDRFFNQLIFPLQLHKSIYLETNGIKSDADIYYPLLYDYSDLDILLIEGILLFKKKYIGYYNYKIWVDCSFDTGLQRAISRNVENLPKERLISDYETFYYAAQRLHFEKDDPQKAADIIFNNDLVLTTN